MPLSVGLIEPVTLPLSHLPDALAGLRLLHLTDLHIKRPRRRYTELIHQLTAVRFDLLLLTGDSMDDVGDEDAALNVLDQLLQTAKPRLGSFGVFGNHDSEAFIDRAGSLPIRWLNDEVKSIEGLPLDIGGVAMSQRRSPDMGKMAAAWGRHRHGAAIDDSHRRMSLMLMHVPGLMHVAADLGIDLVLSGHTHGGQIRLPGRIALKNSSHLPRRLSAGYFRAGSTHISISRGLGETKLPIRLLCPPHAPLYTLRSAPSEAIPLEPDGGGPSRVHDYTVREVFGW